MPRPFLNPNWPAGSNLENSKVWEHCLASKNSKSFDKRGYTEICLKSVMKIGKKVLAIGVTFARCQHTGKVPFLIETRKMAKISGAKIAAHLENNRGNKPLGSSAMIFSSSFI